MARDTVNAFIATLDCEAHEVAPGEWGLVLDAAGRRLDVGLAIRGSLLCAQAWVVWPGAVDPHRLLYLNRRAVLVRFAENLAGDVFVCGEVPVSAVGALDALLGALVEGAEQVRWEART